MFKLRRICVVSMVVAGAVWAVAGFGPANPNRNSGPAENKPSQSVLQTDPDAGLKASDGRLLAARYHLRGRTKRFFQRSPAQVKGSHRAGGKRYPPPRKSSPWSGRARA